MSFCNRWPPGISGAAQAQLRRQNDSAMRDMCLKVVAIRELHSERDDLRAQTEELQRQVKAAQLVTQVIGS